ncbi:hypothetical protein HDU83_002083 [Entophlyctis luteolus]|nr:hypothetical protein HDU83_002083 [Entophlyctis luteolus]
MKRRNSDENIGATDASAATVLEQQQQQRYQQQAAAVAAMSGGKRMRIGSGAMYMANGNAGAMAPTGAMPLMGFSPAQQHMIAAANGAAMNFAPQFAMMQGAGAGPYAANPGFGNMAGPLPSRTVYLGNVPANTHYEDLLNMVKYGPIESIKIVDDKKCCFIAFIDPAAAHAFFRDYQGKRVLIGDQEIRFGWGKPSAVPPLILNDVLNGASRNVYIGQVDATITEEALREEFAPFGPIDQIRVIPEKHIAFVHLCSIAQAQKAVAALPHRPLFSGKKINFGKDRCGSLAGVVGGGGGGGGMGVPGMQGGMTMRTLYLGGLHPDVVVKDICDVVRGGLLQKVHYLPEKNTAFVTFVDPMAASTLHMRGNNEGVVIKGKRVKVGWGKPAQPITSTVFTSIQNGATRTVYVGPLAAGITEERLRQDFSKFGEIEMINMVPGADKTICFISYMDIAFAISAVNSAHAAFGDAYAGMRINFGKDRCNQPLRPPPAARMQGQVGGAPGTMGMSAGMYGMAPGMGGAGAPGMMGAPGMGMMGAGPAGPGGPPGMMGGNAGMMGVMPIDQAMYQPQQQYSGYPYQQQQQQYPQQYY